jgi:hypothetical protein
MEVREEPCVDKFEEIMKDWNFDTICMLASLPVSFSGNFNSLASVMQCVHGHTKPSEPKFLLTRHCLLLPPPPTPNPKKITCVRSNNPYSVFVRGDSMIGNLMFALKLSLLMMRHS